MHSALKEPLQSLKTQVVTCKWFLCIFVNCLPLATTLRVWDLFFHDGNEVLFRNTASTEP